MGVRRNSSARGRLTPLSAAGRSIAQTLKSFCRDRNGSTPNRISAIRLASAWNFSISFFVYPSPRMRRSTFSRGSPFCTTGHTSPRGSGGAGFTKREFGSTSTDHTGLNRFCASCALSRGPAKVRSSPALVKSSRRRVKSKLISGGEACKITAI